LGEIYADRELFSRAKPAWDRIARIQPGTAGGYLEASTIFWIISVFRRPALIDDGRKKPQRSGIVGYEAVRDLRKSTDYKRAIADTPKGRWHPRISPARAR